MGRSDGSVVVQVPTDLIDVPNPRSRNRKGFNEIVENVGKIGLKRPITVSRRVSSGGTRFDLVCGQGRLEAYRALGQKSIPALVIEATTEDCMVMSLVENLARRHHQAVDLLHDIAGMRKRGHSPSEIAERTGFSLDYTRGVLKLMEAKEYRLLKAVEAGQLPITIAVRIAEASDASLHRVLQEAYQSKLLRGRRLVLAKRLIERRRSQGKGTDHSSRRRASNSPSLEGLLRTYKEDTEKKLSIVRRAGLTRDRLMFVAEALRTLFADENFTTLLRAEGLDSLPKPLADRFRRDRTH